MPRNKKLTGKELKFIHEYPKDFNGGQAILRAGYKCTTAQSASQRAGDLLKKREIAEALAVQVKAMFDRADLDTEKTIKQAKRIAFADPRKLVNENGTIALKDLPEELALAIDAVEIEETVDGAGNKTVRYKYRFAGKNSALDKLFKHMALYNETGSKKNPVHVVHTHNINYRSLSLSELIQLRDQPATVLSTSN